MGPSWKLEDDLKTVTVSFPSSPPVVLKLDANEVESVLQNLGEFRALMTPAILNDWTLGEAVKAVPDPRWFVEPELMEGNSLLHLRDPRFGWLHYVIPRETARQLGEFLIRQADAPPLAPPSGKAN